MVKVRVSPVELYDESKSEFITLPGGVYRFEHSLRAISKWESKWNVNFLGNKNLTEEQTIDYFICMCMDGGFRKEYITNDLVEVLSEYINTNHTATTIRSKGDGPNRQVLTSELIYAYMAIARIPFECDKWEINRLLTTISCVSTLQAPKKTRRSKASISKDYSKLNAQRLAKYNTKG